MDNFYWRLDGRTPVPCTLMEASAVLRNNKLYRATATVGGKQILVSTVFLPMHFDPNQLFETMVFVNDQSIDSWRDATWDDAEKTFLHAVAVLEDRFSVRLDQQKLLTAT